MIDQQSAPRGVPSPYPYQADAQPPYVPPQDPQAPYTAARAAWLGMTEDEIRGAKTNPFKVKSFLVFGLQFGSLIAFLVLAFVTKNGVFGLLAALDFFPGSVILIAVLYRGSRRSSEFECVKSEYERMDRRRELRAQIKAGQSAADAGSPFDGITYRYYHGNTDLAMWDIIDRAGKNDYSMVGGCAETLAGIVEAMPPAQKELYNSYVVSSLMNDRATVEKIVKKAVTQASIGVTTEEVRSAQVNPFRSKLITGIVLLVSAVAVLVVGLLTYPPLAALSGVLGPMAAYEIATSAVSYRKFKKLKIQQMQEDVEQNKNR